MVAGPRPVPRVLAVPRAAPAAPLRRVAVPVALAVVVVVALGAETVLGACAAIAAVVRPRADGGLVTVVGPRSLVAAVG